MRFWTVLTTLWIASVLGLALLMYHNHTGGWPWEPTQSWLLYLGMAVLFFLASTSVVLALSAYAIHRQHDIKFERMLQELKQWKRGAP